MTTERQITYGGAVREGLAESIRHDPSVFLMGEGIDDPVSMWGTTAGIAEEFGAQSVLEMPVSENGLAGVAIGAAMAGLRPVMNFQRVEFFLLALEQLFNNAAKAHYVSNGFHRVPLVVRLVIGRGWGQGPGHSQSLEATFAHIPGLKVVMPTFAEDAKGLLSGAIADDNPVVVIEHRWLHSLSGNVPEGYLELPLDGPRVVCAGADVTVVATSHMTLEAIRAAEALKQIDVNVEVIDLRVLRPLNCAPIAKSIRRTGRLITVDTGWTTYGIGAEIVAQMSSSEFSSLKVAPIRLGMGEHPTPSSRGLIEGFYPDAISISRAIGQSLAVDAAKIDKVCDTLTQERGDLPIDVPDPFFKGPF